VLEAIAPWIPTAEGFTISGGEPFDQPDALTVLLAGIRKLSAADILVFTGHPLEAIGPKLTSMYGLIDALIADPFDETAPQTLALRGSDNQRLLLLTALGRERFADYERRSNARDRAVDVMFDDNGEVWLAGIPARDDFAACSTRCGRLELTSPFRSIGAARRVSEARRNDPALPQLSDRAAAHRVLLRGNPRRRDLPLGSLRGRDQRAWRHSASIRRTAYSDSCHVSERARSR
jgi:anaerobic ribonucleoside-triphosphate reductase activating protein